MEDVYKRQTLNDERELRYNDVRGFGTFHLLPVKELHSLTGLAGLGPEPLDDKFTEQQMLELFEGRKRKLKQMLLDQKVLAGIGNIYADEILFVAGLDPHRRVDSLTKQEITSLYKLSLIHIF